MTREEEIKQAANEHPMYIYTDNEQVIANLQAEIERLKNPWHKTSFNISDKEAGRFKGKKYIVSVNREIHKATYEGYGCWTLENGKTETENKFTEVYWMPMPSLPEGGEK